MRSANESIKETTAIITNVTLSAIPIAGEIIKEVFFESRSRIKQERLNKFIESFAAYVQEQQGVPLSVDQIEKEEFGDFFETVLIKVSKTNSSKKIEAFKRLATNQLLEPKEWELADIIAYTIESINETQMRILLNLSENKLDLYNDLFTSQLKKRQEIEDLKADRELQKKSFEGDKTDSAYRALKITDERIADLRQESKEMRKQLELIEEPFLSTAYNLPEPQYRFLIQDMCNKGLLVDRASQSGALPFWLVSMTFLAKEAISFIKEG